MKHAVLLLLAAFVVANDVCTISTSMGTIYLHNLTADTGYLVYGPEYDRKYWFNVCGLSRYFDHWSTQCSQLGDAKVYMLGEKLVCTPLSTDSKTDIIATLIDPSRPDKGVQLHYGPRTVSQTADVYISLYCNKTMTKPRVNYVKTIYLSGLKSYYFSVESQHACPVADQTKPQKSTPACVLNTPEGTIDLNPLTLRDGSYHAQTSQYFYHVNICGSINKFSDYDVCNDTLVGAKGYQLTNDLYHCYPMSDFGTLDITMSLLNSSKPSEGVLLHYNEYLFERYKREVYIRVRCDYSATEPLFRYTNEDYVTGKSTYYFEMRSIHACPSGAPTTTIPPWKKSCKLDTVFGTFDFDKLRRNTSYVVETSSDKFYLNICERATNLPKDCETVPSGAKAYLQTAEYGCWPMTKPGVDDITLTMVDPHDPTKGVEVKYDTYEYKEYKRTTYIKIMCDERREAFITYDGEDHTKGWTQYYFTLKSYYGCVNKV